MQNIPSPTMLFLYEMEPLPFPPDAPELAAAVCRHRCRVWARSEKAARAIAGLHLTTCVVREHLMLAYAPWTRPDRVAASVVMDPCAETWPEGALMVEERPGRWDRWN